MGHWAKLQDMLGKSLIKGKRPPEYFDVTYNLAECLEKVGNGYKGSNPEKAKQQWSQAEKLLKGVLILNPKLNGSDLVVRYKTLLQELAGKLGHAYEDSTAPIVLPPAAPVARPTAKPAAAASTPAAEKGGKSGKKAASAADDLDGYSAFPKLHKNDGK